MIAEQRHHAMTYWLNRFHGDFDGSSFPADHRQPRVRSYRRESTTMPIDNSCWSNFSVVCSREGFAPRDAVLGLLQILLHRYTLTDTIEVGVHFGQVFPVAMDVVRCSRVRDSLSKSSIAASEASANGCSWDELQRWASEAASPLNRHFFRVLFSDSNLDDGHTDAAIADRTQSQCDLVVSLSSNGTQLVLEAQYDTDLYTGETITRILTQLTFLISNLGTLLDQAIEGLPLWPAEEARLLLQEIASNERAMPVNRCIHQRFEDQVRRTPDAIAVVMPSETRKELTYLQLNERANRLAHYLRSKGVGPDVLVGLYVDRTPDLIVALLAILKAGGAYLPIDLSYPPERVSFMLSDSEAPIVITDAETARKLPQTNAIAVCIDRDHEALA
jgi:non-ribosomal peptide synthetase component F